MTNEFQIRVQAAELDRGALDAKARALTRALFEMNPKPRMPKK